MPSNRVEKKYEKAFSQLGEVQTIFPANAKFEMAQMVEQIAKTDQNLADIVSTGQTIPVKAGFTAEEVHTESFNLDAIYKNKGVRGITDKYDEWHNQGFVTHDTPDIAIIDEGQTVHTSQVKYHKNSKSTATQMRQLDKNTHQPKYGEQDSYIGPSDQVHPKDGTTSIADEAHKTALKEEYKGTRPEVAKAARDVEKKATDKLQHDDVSSKPLTKKDAEKIAKDPDSKVRKDIHDEYQTVSTIKHMKQAAVGAAAISAVAAGTLNSIMYCKLVKEGKISESEAVLKIIGETASSAADSAIKASGNVGLQSLVVRYGSKEVTKQIAKNSVRSLARTNAVTVGVVCGIDMIKDLVKLATGKIDKYQFEERNGKNILNTSAGVVGGSVGYGIGGLIPLVGAGFAGALSGALISGLAMQFAIENHIEQPYRELIANTATLTQSMDILQQVSNDIFQGQVIFGHFLEKDAELDSQFATQMEHISDADDRMKKTIDKL